MLYILNKANKKDNFIFLFAILFFIFLISFSSSLSYSDCSVYGTCNKLKGSQNITNYYNVTNITGGGTGEVTGAMLRENLTTWYRNDTNQFSYYNSTTFTELDPKAYNGTLRLTSNHTFNGNVNMVQNLTTKDIIVGTRTNQFIEFRTLSDRGFYLNATGTRFYMKDDYNFNFLMADFADPAKQYLILVNNTMYIKKDYVGIGTTAPVTNFDVVGEANITGKLSIANGTSGQHAVTLSQLQDVNASAGIETDPKAYNGTLRLIDNHTLNGNITINGNLSIDGVLLNLSKKDNIVDFYLYGRSFEGTGTKPSARSRYVDLATGDYYNFAFRRNTNNVTEMIQSIYDNSTTLFEQYFSFAVNTTGFTTFKMGESYIERVELGSNAGRVDNFIIYSNITYFSGRANGNTSVGINNPNPSYPLDVGSNVSGISIYAQANISATGYNTRTSLYDKSKGKALNYIKDSDNYKKIDGSINHSAFYGYAGKIYSTDYSKPIYYLDYFGEGCQDNGCLRLSYPYKKLEEQVSLNAEIDVLRQAIYEMKNCAYLSSKWDDYKNCILAV